MTHVISKSETGPEANSKEGTRLESNRADQEAPVLPTRFNHFELIEFILKAPTAIINDININPRTGMVSRFFGIMLLSLVVYGVILGSFSGGNQYWIAALKLLYGMTLSVFICLPSLYIFTSLNGIDKKFSQVFSILLLAMSLSTILLVGFAPIAWIFSQSTDSVVFMGFLHLLIMAGSLYFGLKMLLSTFNTNSGRQAGYLALWIIIFVFVIMQMTTAMRPLLDISVTFFPTEKKFFLVHWLEIIFSGLPE
ncbi:hypothetical protein ACFL27_23760 [candidate division CSSED10-310 bacterium]|uniref:Yip1 domain-containing protein n=1 Tax=candidate division CSSED10-310 bacterium TaxID=2855610 RepID=A0ABV6Z458_UNCC1